MSFLYLHTADKPRFELGLPKELVRTSYKKGFYPNVVNKLVGQALEIKLKAG